MGSQYRDRGADPLVKIMKLQFAFLIFSMVIFLPQSKAASEPPEAKAKTVVVVQPLADSPGWAARAIETSIKNEISHSTRLSLVEDIDANDLGCRITQVSCLLTAAKQRGLDIVLIGKLSDKKLVLQSFETWTKTIVDEQSFRLGENTNLEKFRHQIFQLVKPIVQLGGLLDQQAVVAMASTQPGGWLWAFVSGIAWALALMLSYQLVIPGLKGAEKIRLGNIIPATRAWIVSVFERSVFFFAIIFISISITAGLSQKTGFGSETVWALVVPVAILGGCLAYMYLLNYISSSKNSLLSFLNRLPIDIEHVTKHEPTARSRKMVGIGALVLVIATMSTWITQSVKYRATYLQRIDHMREIIREQQKQSGQGR